MIPISDEVAVAAMAMSCSQDIPEVKVSMNRAIAYLRQLRRNDGSYGSVYTTSLVLQVSIRALLHRPTLRPRLTARPGSIPYINNRFFFQNSFTVIT